MAAPKTSVTVTVKVALSGPGVRRQITSGLIRCEDVDTDAAVGDGAAGGLCPAVSAKSPSVSSKVNVIHRTDDRIGRADDQVLGVGAVLPRLIVSTRTVGRIRDIDQRPSGLTARPCGPGAPPIDGAVITVLVLVTIIDTVSSVFAA